MICNIAIMVNRVVKPKFLSSTVVETRGFQEECIFFFLRLSSSVNVSPTHCEEGKGFGMRHS